jgi:hypothetical protein
MPYCADAAFAMLHHEFRSGDVALFVHSRTALSIPVDGLSDFAPQPCELSARLGTSFAIAFPKVGVKAPTPSGDILPISVAQTIAHALNARFENRDA